MTRKTLCAILLLVSLSSAAGAVPLFDPNSTYAVITGVLSWQDRSLSSYSADMRKDRELHRRLLAMGVPEGNTVLLLDGQCTREKMRAAIAGMAARAKPGSTLIFYYAGHGIRDGERIYFANYDIATANKERTGFALSSLDELMGKSFRGSRVVFMADCCYSGGLRSAAASLAARGHGAVSLTSADSSNVSSGNWTFTQTVIDCLSGDPLADRDGDGTVSLDEAVSEVRDAMKFRERQKTGFYAKGVPGSLALSKARSAGRPAAGGWKAGDYAMAPYGGRNCVSRVVALQGSSASVEFFFYNRKERSALPLDRLRKIAFKRYPAGSAVNVTWGKEVYPAKIVKTEGDFHLITYPGWPTCWDEWILDNRVVTGAPGKAVSVLWQGTWYPAIILKEEKGRYFIRYSGYDSSWDEWVGPERIRK